MKQPTIKSLQENIKVLKEELKYKETHISDYEVAIQEKNAEISVLKKERDMHHMASNEHKTDAVNLSNKLVATCNELNTIKSKWWYKIFAK